MEPVQHVIWDWNGTLVDDLTQTVRAINEVMTAFGRHPITPSDYGRSYRRPVRLFYEDLLKRELDGETSARVDHLFHEAYQRQLHTITLAPGAAEVLAGIAATGRTQSVLSMWWHDRLVREVQRHGIARWFVRVDGYQPGHGDLKAAALVRHVTALGLDPAAMVVVGDALDDVEAGRAVGARAILVASTHHPERLRRAGVPLVNRLTGVLPLLMSA